MSRTTRNRAATTRRRADDVVALAKDLSLVAALGCQARVEIAQGEWDQAGDDARRALDIGADSHGHVTIPDAFECLAYIAGDAGSYQEAARLFGAAAAARLQTGGARFKTLDADHKLRLAAVREALGESDFQTAWDEGAALTIEDAIAYARRGRGQAVMPQAQADGSQSPSSTADRYPHRAGRRLWRRDSGSRARRTRL